MDEATLRRLLAHDPGNAMARNELGNLLLAEGRRAEALACYRLALAVAPDAPALSFNVANALAADGRDAEAEPFFDRALALDPIDVGARTNRANLRRRAGRLLDALDDYYVAARADPGSAMARHNVAALLMELNRPAEAVPWLQQARAAASGPAADIDRAKVEIAIATALTRLGRPEEALACLRALPAEVREDDPTRLLEGLARLTLGDLRQGFALYEARLSDPRFRLGLPDLPAAPWRGQALPGRTLLASAEQGLGDAIQFARYVPLLRARGLTVVLQVQPPLMRLLGPLADAVCARGETPGDADAHVSLMSLPFVFATGLDDLPADVPYLAADPKRVAAWRRKLGARRGLRVGLAWSGNPDHPWDALRSIPVAALAPVLAVGGVEFHAMQPQVRPADEAALAGFPQLRRHPLPDFAEAAALMTLMDRVVTVDTAAAHLAGALGRPTDLLLQHAPDWRWMLRREDSPWYPTLHLIRQTAPGDWSGPVAHVAAGLAEMRDRR